jgi:hypothetical protein
VQALSLLVWKRRTISWWNTLFTPQRRFNGQRITASGRFASVTRELGSSEPMMAHAVCSTV